MPQLNEKVPKKADTPESTATTKEERGVKKTSEYPDHSGNFDRTKEPFSGVSQSDPWIPDQDLLTKKKGTEREMARGTKARGTKIVEEGEGGTKRNRGEEGELRGEE